jgi:hypothetical protein
MDEKPQREIAGGGHTTSGSKGQEHEHGVRHKGPGEHRHANANSVICHRRAPFRRGSFWLECVALWTTLKLP